MSTAALPIIESCDGCGACCMRQSSPPGYVYVMNQPVSEFADGPFADDAVRVANLPAEAKAELEQYREKLMRGDFDGIAGGDFPCCWLDLKTRRCRWYEHRPDTCRYELELNDDGCHRWRDELHDGPGARGRLQRLLAMFNHRNG